MSLKGLQLEELGCRQELWKGDGHNKDSVMLSHHAGVSWFVHSYLHDFSVAYVQGLSAAAVQILHDQLQIKDSYQVRKDGNLMVTQIGGTFCCVFFFLLLHQQ